MKKKAAEKKQLPQKLSGALGDFLPVPRKFAHLDKFLKQLASPSFKQLHGFQKIDRINALLLEMISQEKSPCFLLPAVMDFIEKINQLGWVESYTFYQFELWLNDFSGLSAAQNALIRGKIVGKYIPRDAYQSLFPIGMEKRWPGSHYVTAHSSPDLDTTVASFWGWVDAFGACIGTGVHIWNLPGGPPASQVEIDLLFLDLFGPAIFQYLPKKRTSLSLSGLDLLSQEGLVRKQIHLSNINIEQDAALRSVVLIDEEGCYLGDWRSYDVESVRQVINLLNGCLRWFENLLHVKLIGLFVKQKLAAKDVKAFIQSVLQMRLIDCDSAREFSEKHTKDVQEYLIQVLHVKEGLNCQIASFAKAMDQLGLFDFVEFVDLIEKLGTSSLFDRSGLLLEDRPKIFERLEKIIQSLDRAIYSMRLYVERLDVALSIKKQVFGYQPQHVSHRADLEEIRSKIGNSPYITVTTTDQNEKIFPLGVVYSSDLHKPVLGTVTLRDFCNREETKIPPYFEVISVIDHHKSALQTLSASMVLVSDAQSSNVLCAEIAFDINDAYGLGGMEPKQIEAQLKSIEKNIGSFSQKRIAQRLLQRSLVAQKKGEYFIDPSREYYEYLHFLYAIFDDTDLLTKMSQKDVECVAHLLNRMKSISLQKEVEIVSLDHFPKDSSFVRSACRLLLQNPDLYSMYSKIYRKKEELIEKHCKLAAKNLPSMLFDDTKEQNGCARVGQTKLYHRNIPTFKKCYEAVQKAWYSNAVQFWKDRPEIDLHLHMVSTLVGADELYKGEDPSYKHQDELWVWIPFTEQSIEHLKGFLNAFSKSPRLMGEPITVELHASKAKEYQAIFSENFPSASQKVQTGKSDFAIAVIKYKAGLLNSRKGMISPYLPRSVG